MQPYAAVSSRIKPYEAVCSRMKPYVAVCSRMHPARRIPKFPIFKPQYAKNGI
jgi:hypothetical protein